MFYVCVCTCDVKSCRCPSTQLFVFNLLTRAEYRSALHCLRSIVTHEGWLALYKGRLLVGTHPYIIRTGGIPATLKTALTSMVTFFVYEEALRHLRQAGVFKGP
jgi:hypothetical protein